MSGRTRGDGTLSNMSCHHVRERDWAYSERHSAQERIGVARAKITRFPVSFQLETERPNSVIQLSSLSKSFGGRVLLDAVSWQIDDGDRVGLAGPNGAGKTTLLKMMAGFEEPDSGLITKPAGLTIGYLPQDGLTHSGRTVAEEAGHAFKPLLDMRQEISAI